MKVNRKQLLAIVLAVTVVTGMGGLAAAAAPSTNTETTDTTYTSPLTAGDTVEYNTSTNTTHSFSADSKNASVTVLQNGTELGTWDNSTDKLSLEDSASGTHYYNVTFADDGSDFDGLEAGPGENVTLTINRTNDSELSSPDQSEIDYFFVNKANLTLAGVTSGDTTVGEPGYGVHSIPFVGGDNKTDPAKMTHTVDVAGDTQEEIVIDVADSDGQDALDETYQSSTDAGGVTWMGIAQVGDTYVPVMAAGESAPDWLDETQYAYAEVSDGGEEVTIKNAGHALESRDSTVDVTVFANEKANMGQVTSVMTSYDAEWYEAYYTAAMSGEKISTDHFGSDN